MKKPNFSLVIASFSAARRLALLCLLPAAAFAQSAVPPAEHHHAQEAPVAKAGTFEGLTIPDVAVLDQEGKEIRFSTDLIKDKLVAINFVFTSCTTICPPMGATFAKLQRTLDPDLANEVQLISISVDPTVDTPERLKAWSAKFGAGPGWRLVTGNKAEMDALARSLGGFAGKKEDHTPFTLIGDAARNRWTRAYGIGQAAQLLQVLQQLRRDRQAGASGSYFPDLELIDQDGKKVRFYSDLLKGKVVVINSFFATCAGACPPMNSKLAKIQQAFGDRIGRDLFLISITVDPAQDTPQRLKAYAERFSARPGWSFLTGEKQTVDAVLYKLGQYVKEKEAHATLLIVGNEPKGLWKKVFGFGKTTDMIKAVEETLAGQ